MLSMGNVFFLLANYKEVSILSFSSYWLLRCCTDDIDSKGGGDPGGGDVYRREITVFPEKTFPWSWCWFAEGIYNKLKGHWLEADCTFNIRQIL